VLTLQRKEKELAAVAAKIEDEQSLGIKMQKQVKELSVSAILWCLKCHFFTIAVTAGLIRS
jgi:hypothetical protein